MPIHLLTGQKGEDLAAELLEKKGYEIVRRNYRAGKAEIDLIARQDNWLVFVEVKTRSNLHFGFPENFITPKKVTLLRQGADQYVYETNWQGNVRFDVISVIQTGKTFQLDHFEDALS
ncbi:MAG: YraN family protein [Siphonobacter sp.]